MADTSQRVGTLLASDEIDRTELVVSIKDSYGRYLRVNRGYESLLGLDREQVHGKTDGALNPRDIADRVIANDEAARAVEVPTEVVETLLGREGRIEMRSCRFSLRDEDGHAWAVCCISALPEDVAAARAERARLAQLEPGTAPAEDAALGLAPEAAAALEAELEGERERAATLATELEQTAARADELATARAAAQAAIDDLRRDLTRTQSELDAAREELTAASARPAGGATAQLHVRLAEALGAATTLDGAARVALAELGDTGGWDVAVCWLADDSHPELRSVSVWCAASLAGSAFETHTWRGSITPGAGAIGRGLQQGAPVWVENLADDADCARSRTAQEAGLVTAAAAPIRHGSQTRGLVELYRREPLDRDDEALAVATALGLHLGQLAHMLELAEKPRWR